ncbi:MAG: hypothetical protein ACLP5H_29735, partial [Desulfomonilaceae bacterium]
MKAALSILAATLILAALLLLGCVPGLQSAKPPTEAEPPSGPQGQSEQAEPPKAPMAPGQGADQAATPPPPAYLPPPPPGREQISEAAVDLRLKDEVNEAAMRFAKEIPSVKYVKTCFSKLYGGWYLMLYVEKGKKISLEQFSWNTKSKEWEVAGRFQVPPKQLEYHLKGEVADEKCFRL